MLKIWEFNEQKYPLKKKQTEKSRDLTDNLNLEKNEDLTEKNQESEREN